MNQDVRKKSRENSNSKIFRLTTSAKIKKGSQIKTKGFIIQTNGSVILQNFDVTKTIIQKIMAIIIGFVLILGGVFIYK